MLLTLKRNRIVRRLSASIKLIPKKNLLHKKKKKTFNINVLKFMKVLIFYNKFLIKF